MTCYEKYITEYPGPVRGCPHDYGYLPRRPADCYSISCFKDCWNGEIPDKPTIHPCNNCNVGWGSISTKGCKSCHDTCERLANYNHQQMKGETMTGVKETACTTCTHREVCKYKDEFLAAQKAVDDTFMNLLNGERKRLVNISYIKPVELKCKFYRKEVATR